MEVLPANIENFLLARISDNQAAFGASLGRHESLAVVMSAAEQIHQHRSRSMTVTSHLGTETMTRCDICHHQPVYPCDVLKLMANTYATHPNFDVDWNLPGAVVA